MCAVPRAGLTLPSPPMPLRYDGEEENDRDSDVKGDYAVDGVGEAGEQGAGTVRCDADIYPAPRIETPPSREMLANDEASYQLKAVVVHIGASQSSGHYVTYAKCHGEWLLFDDDEVTVVDEADMHLAFGGSHTSSSAYMLW